MKPHVLLFSIFLASFSLSAQDGANALPQNPADLIKILQDSGEVNPQHQKSGFWKEYFFTGFMSPRLIPLVYDSLVRIDSLYQPPAVYRSEGMYLNNKKTGIWKTWVCHALTEFATWNQFSEVEYVDDLKTGLEVVHKNSEVCHTYYKHGKPDSVSACYDGDRVISLRNYKDGKLHGSEIAFDEHGKPVMEIVHENGKASRMIFYNQGFNEYLLGAQKAYYENKTLKSEGVFENGVPHGLHKSYYQDGAIEKEIEFEYGEINGIYRLFYPNGQLQREITYLRGKPWHAGVALSKKGSMQFPGSLKDGTGSLCHYNTNGKLEKVEHYEKGAPVNNE